jgi:hypothetical protein
MNKKKLVKGDHVDKKIEEEGIFLSLNNQTN